MNISSAPRTIAGDTLAASSGRQSASSSTTILSATATSPPSGGGSSGAAFSVTAAIGGLLLLLTLVVGGPIACLCYVTLQVRRLRQKAKEARSVIFASQWRAENPFMQEVDLQLGPDEEPNDEMQLCGSGKDRSRMQHVGLTACSFTYTPVPADFNGVSTALFQSAPPVISPSSPLFPSQEEIRFNPGIRNQRQEQCVQCARPLMPYDNTTAAGESARDAANKIITISYFEITILAFSRDGHVALTEAGQPMEDVNVAVGLAARPAPPFRLPGRDPISIALHSKTGRLFVNDLDHGQPLAETWSTVGSTVGCGYDVEQGVVFFTKDDHVAQAQSSTSHRGGGPKCLLYRTGYPVPASPDSFPLFPTIGCDADVTVVVNFGQRGFKFLNNMKPITAPASGPSQDGLPLPSTTEVVQSASRNFI